jgi:diacylglycerol kinase (ATP)
MNLPVHIFIKLNYELGSSFYGKMINPNKFIKSVPHAFRGIISLIKNDNNFRIHLLAVVVVIIVGLYLGFTEFEWLAVIITMGIVLALEAINTAIETIIDLISPDYHDLAKKTKDVAAGAVLLFVFAALGVAGVIIWHHFM